MKNLLKSVLSYNPSNKWIEDSHFYIHLFEKGSLHKSLFKPGIDSSAQIDPSAKISKCSYIGPECKVGPNCKVSNGTILTKGVHLGFCADVYAAIILDRTIIAHSACISHSIVGPNCNLAFGFVTATRHLYNKPIKVFVDKKSTYFSSSKHHGSVLMDKIQAGVHTSTMPGSTLISESRILPHKFCNGYHE